MRHAVLGPRAIGEVGGAPAPTAATEVSPAQESLPISAAEHGSTPVSGALAGNPPPPAPPEPPPVEEPAAPAGEANGEAHASADQPTTVQPGGDQPTQAFPSLEPGTGAASASSMTSGDPLASRERSAE